MSVFIGYPSFMAYQMMKGKKGNNDGFPSIPGMIATYASFARAAIAGQTICNGYFSTDEDDEKVLDWYKKQYPWLFPD